MTEELNKLSLTELQLRQQWSLNQKIDHTLGAIEQFLSKTNGKGYVAFSGGKDSTVLLNLCRMVYPDIQAVFSNTGVEYPEILKFVRQTDNVTIIRPEMTFREVVAEHGFPLVSKNVADKVGKAKRKPDGKVYHNYFRHEKKSQFNVSPLYHYLLDQPYDISPKCCDILKKEPSKKFQKESGLFPISGEMASESITRAGQWVKGGGCNMFGRTIKSKPLSIWTESDIWEFIHRRGIKISEVYHKGATRTGCAGCAFGAHLECPSKSRYELLFRLHPKFYNWFMGAENNGITYREAIRELFSRTGRYLPDEKPRNLFSDILDDEFNF